MSRRNQTAAESGHMPPYLILTVGTGTAGAHSNLAAGLRRTVEMLAPGKFWLVPSTDEVSRITADLVSEGMPSFQPWAADAPYRMIGRPDSLEDCRAAVREVIARARTRLPEGTRLLVNPTSGTKQMSVGAALAALDAGLGELVFTIGQRADGVVKTGTEKLETFDTAGYFAERDHATAINLASAGAHSAAATLLSRHASLAAAADTARCLHEWERQNYAEARRIASRCGALAAARKPLEKLAAAASARTPQPVIITDLLHTAALIHQRNEYESSLVLTCRAMEMGLRLALHEITGLCEPYVLSKLLALPVNQGIKDRCAQISNDGIHTILNLSTVARIIFELGHALGGSFRSDREIQPLIRARNELMHQLRAVSRVESRSALDRVNHLLACLELPPPAARPAIPPAFPPAAS